MGLPFAKLFLKKSLSGILGVSALFMLLSGCMTNEEKQNIQHLQDTTAMVWQKCKTDYPDWFADKPDNKLYCTTLSVPLNQHEPSAERVSLALSVLPATQKAIGNLIIIAGGPGEHSLDMSLEWLDSNAPQLQQIRKQYNIIGYAPRGVAPSTPAISCGDTPIDELPSDTEPKDVMDLCEKHTGKAVLAHISSQDAVLDLERIRVALGENQLNAIAYSYGTKVLIAYAERFPAHLRAGVLDGVVDVTQTESEWRTSQELGLQDAFERFVADCLTYYDCVFESLTPDQDSINYQTGAMLEPVPSFAEQFHQILRHIDSKKLTDRYEQVITADSVLSVFSELLYYQETWKDARWVLDGLSQGKTAFYNEFAKPKQQVFEENSRLVAINCADSATPWHERNKSAQSDERAQIDALTSFDDYPSNSQSHFADLCFYWPYDGTDSYAMPNKGVGTPQLLFVAQTRDPATPYDNAIKMAQVFGAPLITRNANGHTLALQGLSQCVDSAVAEYLSEPNKPMASQTCQD